MATRTAVAGLVLCAAFMALVRLHTYDEPLEMDASTYAVIGRELLAGRHLYSELWDHKPPAIHVTFAGAQLVFGAGPLHVFALGLLSAVVTLLGVYVGARAVAGRPVALLAAVLWAFVSGDAGLQANQPNTESFINAGLVWTWALLVSAPAARLAWARAAGVGALIATASLYKHVAVVPGGLMLGAALALDWAGSRDGRAAVGRAALSAAVVVAAWLGVAAWFAADGRWPDFWGAVFAFNSQYAGSMWRNLREAIVFDRLIPPLLYPVQALIAVAALGALRGWGSRRAGILIGAYAVGVAVAVALPGQFHPHYYQLWLPVLVISAAVGVAALAPVQYRAGGATGWILPAGALLAGLMLLVELPSLADTPDQWSRRKFGERLVRNVEVAKTLNQLLLPGEAFFEWGHEAELYYYTGRHPPTGEFRSDYLLDGPRGYERTERLMRDLERADPEIVLISTAHPVPLGHPFARWLADDYREADGWVQARIGARDYRVLVRRDGAITTRLDIRMAAGSGGDPHRLPERPKPRGLPLP